MLFKFIKVSFLLLFLAIYVYPQGNLNTFKIDTPQELQEFFQYTTDRIPLISGHRGGAKIGYPENCIATFEHTLSRMHAFFEIDPRLTKDGVAVVLHDETLNRTTTGTGKISDHTWAEIQQLKLKDPDGNITQYGVHRLEEVIQWAKGKTVLMIDKKDVPLAQLLQIITDNEAESCVLVSSYDPSEAKYYYERNPNIMFEAFILNNTDMLAYEATGVPWKNIVAYLSQSTNVTLYNNLHARGVMCIFYTAKELENEPDKNIRIASYKNVINIGADILLSERLMETSDAIKEFIPQQSSKWKFFQSAIPELNDETVTDIDGNIYKTVKIGNQVWTTSNLKTTKYRNGNAIATGLNNADWKATTSGAYTVYPFVDAGEANETAVIAKYGLLYNAYAVNDSRNIAPEGWHVATDEDWLALEIYCSMPENEARAEGWTGLISPRIKSEDIWSSPNIKSGWDDFGFTALPGGNRLAKGTYEQINERGYFWTATTSGTTNYRRVMAYNLAGIHRSTIDAASGYSVRLVKDNTTTPVNLINYQLIKGSTFVSLSWETISEQNNDYFVIERSSDGQNFKEIRRIYGKGITNDKQRYAFTDYFPLSGINYYRLRQYDTDGTVNNYGVRTVNFDFNDTASCSVYPNPVKSSQITLNFVGYAEEMIDVSLVNIMGITVYKENIPIISGQTEYLLDLNKKPAPGHYILTITGNKVNKSLRVVIL